MRIQVAGRQMDVGEALRSRIENELADSVGKFFSRATDAVVTVGKSGGVDEEVKRIVDETYQRVKEILLGKKEKLIELARLLIEREVIEEPDLKRVLQLGEATA